MTSVLLKTVKKAFANFPTQTIYIAYSGGVDSQVLLDLILRLKARNEILNPIKICHIHHGLSSNADYWQNFAREQAAAYQIEFLTKCVNVKKINRQSLEAQARSARYQALETMTQSGDVIVTGHHNDDQAETFLLALKRGSGISGLGAMHQISDLNGRCLLRPLLNITREDIEKYAKEQNLTWIEDESNDDIDYDRNFLRHQIMPALQERWPAFLTTVARSAQHCQDAQILLDEIAEQDLQNCLLNAQCLSLKALQQLSSLRINQVLRAFLKAHGSVMPSQQQLVQLVGQLSAEQDKTPAVKVGDYWLRRFHKQLWLTPSYADLSSWQYQMPIPQENTAVILPDKLGQLIFIPEIASRLTANTSDLVASDHEMLIETLKETSTEKEYSEQVLRQAAQLSYLTVATGDIISIKFIHQNPSCLPSYRKHRRPLKKVLKELNIAPWLRTRIPLIYINDQLAMVAGHFICQQFIAQVGQPALKVTWQQLPAKVV